MLADEQKACIESFDGPVRPSQYNKIGHHTWWDGRDYDNVMARWRMGLPPPPKHTVSSPNLTALSYSLRLATFRRSPASAPPRPRRGMPGISFWVPKKEPPSLKKPNPIAGTRVKVEPGTIKIEPNTVKIKPDIVKPEPTSPEPSEAWRTKYAVSLVYRSEEDGEWASWQAVVCLSVKEAGFVVSDSDDDGSSGETGFETGREDGEEEDGTMDFSTFD
jgi:hypothetical protein